jgi:hypothetical protein
MFATLAFLFTVLAMCASAWRCLDYISGTPANEHTIGGWFRAIDWVSPLAKYLVALAKRGW